MDVNKRLSLKRVEISLNNFNIIAIPHHIDLLNKHKINITKFQNAGDLERIRNEQINATRIVVQLRHLLEEMDVLRQQVDDRDIPKFDKLTEKSRNLTIKAIKEYIDMPGYSECHSSPSLSSGYSSHSPNTMHDRKSDKFEFTPGSEKLTLQLDEAQLTEEQMRQKESCLKSWERLQDEVQDLHEIFVKFQDVIDTQKDTVSAVDKNVEMANVNVEVGTSSLARAERFKTVWYPIAGAVIGGCIAGPIGLVTGLKVGGLAILSGTALGFTGGRILKKKKEETLSASIKSEIITNDSDKKDD